MDARKLINEMRYLIKRKRLNLYYNSALNVYGFEMIIHKMLQYPTWGADFLLSLSMPSMAQW